MRAPSPPVEAKGQQGSGNEHDDGPRRPSGLGIDVGIAAVQSVHLETNEDGTEKGEDDPEPHNGQDAPWSVLPTGLGLREAGKIVFDIGLRLARPREAGQNNDRNLLAAEGLIRPHFFGDDIPSIAVSGYAICYGIGMSVRNDGIFRREALPQSEKKTKVPAGRVPDVSDDGLRFGYVGIDQLVSLRDEDANVDGAAHPKDEEGQEHVLDIIQVDDGSIGIYHFFEGDVIVLVLVVLLRRALGGKDEEVAKNKKKRNGC
mmetsp:Transcript_5960/g.16751  ORF Transcript_5960/g.16751 Transcript_5960/m.16751 type:complete len:259 (-) Transcript_5960:311-1087(-)